MPCQLDVMLRAGDEETVTLWLPYFDFFHRNITMASEATALENDNAEAVYKTKETCLLAMWNKFYKKTTPYCRPDWDEYSEMCWEPTPASGVAKLPCPDDGHLNPNQFATRICLPNATWYINHTFDNRPFTNFTNCFHPVDLSAEDDLKKLVNSKIIFMLKSMDEYKSLFLIAHAVSVFLLAVVIIISGAAVSRLQQRKASAFPYLSLAIGAAALLVNNIVTMSVSSVDDATNVIKCRAAKSLALFTTILFYECFFAYLYVNIVNILHLTVRPLFTKIFIASVVTLTIMLVFAEMFVETLSNPTKYCGFGTLQSSFHWLTTTPRILLILVHICLNSVTIFGTLCLKHPHLEKRGELTHIRQRSISALVLVLYNVLVEILHVLVHAEAYMQYTDLPVRDYVQAYSFVVAAHGIVFSLLLCFCDLYVLTMLKFPLKCAQYVITENEGTLKAVPMYSMSSGHYQASNSPVSDPEYNAIPQAELPSASHRTVDAEYQIESAEDHSVSSNKRYISELYFGSLKQTHI